MRGGFLLTVLARAAIFTAGTPNFVMNSKQRRLRFAGELIILVVLAFHGYTEWQQIERDSVGVTVTWVDVVVAWAVNSVVSTVWAVLFSPTGFICIVLFLVLYARFAQQAIDDTALSRADEQPAKTPNEVESKKDVS